MKNIIVPIDFSEESLNGLEFALRFAEKVAVNVEMVYVQKKSSDYYHGTAEDEIAYAKKRFDGLVGDFGANLNGESKLGYIVKKGKIYREVVNQAEAYDSSFIIASTHGASGFEEVFVGSNAYKIVSATERPVFTLKGKCPEEIKKILVPIDISEDSRQKVPFTAEIAEVFGAEVIIAAINQSTDFRLMNKVKTYGKQACSFFDGKAEVRLEELNAKHITKDILDLAEKEDVDLISIMTEQVSDISLLLGNSAHQLIAESKIPILCNTPKEIRLAGNFSTMAG